MTDGTILVHNVAHPTVTLFITAPKQYEEFIEEHPNEDGPVLKVKITAPNGISISPNKSSNISPGYRNAHNEYMLILDSPDEIRASFDWTIDAPDRSFLDSEAIQVQLFGVDGTLTDTANIRI